MPPAALRPLRHRNYAVVWGAGMVSNIGTWMQTVAVGALVTDITRQPFWTALAYIAGFLPNGVLAPVGGALADRFDRRRAVVVGVLIEAGFATALGLLVRNGQARPALVTLVVFLAGCVAAVRLPFQQAMLPDLVPREDIVGAVSLGSAQWNLGRVVGPSLAGVVIVLGSYRAAFFINAASFLAVVVAMVVIRLGPQESEDEWRGLAAHIRGGLRAVRRDPGLRAAMALVAAAASLTAPFMALIPAFAQILTDGDAKELGAATGAMTAAQGVGAVAGALALATLADRMGRRRAVTAALVVTPLAIFPYALSPTVPVAVAAVVVVGAAYIGILSGLSAILQLRAAPAVRGRVLSLYFATLSVVFALGAGAQGAVANVIGLRATMAVGAGLMLGVVGWLRLARPHVLRALDDPHEAGVVPAVADEPVAVDPSGRYTPR